MFRTWAGRLFRWNWPHTFVSAELMLMDGKVWARLITEGPFAGGWQFPPELCTPGQAPPRPYQSPNVSLHYTPRRGLRQFALARVVALKRVRYRYRWVPLVVRTLYLMDVVFSERIGNPDGTGTGVDGITVPCTDHTNPVASLMRWVTRARQRYALG